MTEPATYDPSIAAELATEAYSIAAEAGAAILDALGSEIFVSYKDSPSGENTPIDPVSDIDRAVETLIRERVAARYPDHAFFGEETAGSYEPGPRFTWAVDPIDGTQNFVNGLPFYSSSIGVFDGAVPVAGAIWGVATHQGGPGVYHAERGGPLHFNGEPMERHGHFSNGRLRTLAAIPMGYQRRAANWDYRALGSTALEGALVAAGALAAQRSPDPHVWDIAGSTVLAIAAGQEVWTKPKGKSAWEPLETIDPAGFATWRQPVAIASAAASEEIRK